MPLRIRARARLRPASLVHDDGWKKRCQSARRSKAAWPPELRGAQEWWRYYRDRPGASCCFLLYRCRVLESLVETELAPSFWTRRETRRDTRQAASLREMSCHSSGWDGRSLP